MRIRTLAYAAVAVIAVGTNVVAAPAQAVVQKPRQAIAKVAAGQALAPIEIMYERANFEGDSWIIMGDHDCSHTLDDIDYSMPNVDFELGSYRLYRNCLARHYELPNFEGRFIDWDGSSAELPFRVRSIQWS